MAYPDNRGGCQCGCRIHRLEDLVWLFFCHIGAWHQSGNFITFVYGDFLFIHNISGHFRAYHLFHSVSHPKLKQRGHLIMCASRPEPSLKAIFSNWKNNPASFTEKLKMAGSNNLIKIKTGKNCCGHHGEVGCWILGDGPGSGPKNQMWQGDCDRGTEFLSHFLLSVNMGTGTW